MENVTFVKMTDSGPVFAVNFAYYYIGSLSSQLPLYKFLTKER